MPTPEPEDLSPVADPTPPPATTEPSDVAKPGISARDPRSVTDFLRVAVPLVFAVLAAFSGVLKNGFVNWDDPENFLGNTAYMGLGWPQVRWAFTTSHLGVYQPLGWLLDSLEFTLFGLSPTAFHATSLVLFALVAVALYATIAAVLARARPDLAAGDPWTLLTASGLAAALFATHPLRTEVVAWASCQPYLPCALFALLAVLAYLRAHPAGAAPRPAWSLAALGLFLAAVLSKAPAVALPAVLVILDAYPLRRIGPGRWLDRSAWVEKLPFLALAAAFAFVAYRAKEADASLMSLARQGPAARLALGGYAPMFYLEKTVLPVGIINYYALPEPFRAAEPRFLLGGLLTLAATAAAVALRRRWPAVLAAWLAYLALLAPGSGLVQVGRYLAADRYAFLPLMPLCALLAGGLAIVPRRHASVAFGAGLVAVLALVWLSGAQVRTWRDPVALWTHAILNGRDPSSTAQLQLGLALAQQAALPGLRDEDRKQLLADAEIHLRSAERLDPQAFDVENSLGGVLAQQGKFPEAEDHLRAAIRLAPDDPRPRKNLGLVLARLDRTAEAVESFREALKGLPGDPDTHASLGLVLARLDRVTEAEAHLRTTLQLAPGLSEARRTLAILLARHGRVPEAAALLAEGLKLDPRDEPTRALLDQLSRRPPARSP